MHLNMRKSKSVGDKTSVETISGEIFRGGKRNTTRKYDRVRVKQRE